MTPATVDVVNRTITLSRSFNTAGVYNVTLTMLDGFDGTATTSVVNGDAQLNAMIVVFAPDGTGFVTGVCGKVI